MLIEGGSPYGGSGGDSFRRRSRIISILIKIEYALIIVLAILGYLNGWISSTLLGFVLAVLILGVVVLFATGRKK